MHSAEKRSFDAVIIGGGNGGLAAAAQLSVRGKKVILFEQHNIVGGFSTSFVRGRFEFEASLHQLADVSTEDDPGAILKLFKRLGVEIDWVEIPEAYRLILKNPRLDVALPFGIEEYTDAMEKNIPGSRNQLERFFTLTNEIMEGLEYIARSRGRPDRQILLKQHTNFLKTAGYTADQVFKALKLSQDVRNIISAYWCYLGVPTNKVSFIIFAAMFHTFMQRKAYIPRLRSTEFALALEAKIREKDSCVECNTKVEQILVKNSHVVGVKTSHGEVINTSHVLCNASPTTVYNHMVEPKSEVPEVAYQWVNAREHSVTAFVVYLGLDISHEDLGLNEYSYFIFDSMKTNQLYNDLKKFARPSAQATCVINAAVPDCSPPGTTIMSITVLFKPEAWKSIKLVEYFEKKQEMADYLIDNFETATGVKIRDHIEEIEIATPITYANYTNAYQGVIYGYETSPWDGIMPRMMMMREDELIKGLKFVGGWGLRSLGFSSSLLSGQIMGMLTFAELMKKEEDM
jgi:prolycopene isomerase